MNFLSFPPLRLFFVLLTYLGLSTQVQATIVNIETNQGNIEVNLFDETTPITVNNFLNYVRDGRYDNVVFHRLVKDFVLQGGGFTAAFDEQAEFDGFSPIEVDDAITNEPVYSNVAGTIAMAKIGGAVNSATSQFFFNLTDSSENLDQQNGGFTVFGQVSEQSMELLTQLNEFTQVSFVVDPYTSVPIKDYANILYFPNDPAYADNFIIINRIEIIDDGVSTAAGLNPVLNTSGSTGSEGSNGSTDGSNGGSNGSSSSSSGGGSVFWVLFLTIFARLIRIRKL